MILFVVYIMCVYVCVCYFLNCIVMFLCKMCHNMYEQKAKHKCFSPDEFFLALL